MISSSMLMRRETSVVDEHRRALALAQGRGSRRATACVKHTRHGAAPGRPGAPPTLRRERSVRCGAGGPMPMLPPALTADWRCRSGRAEFRVLAGDDPTDHAWAGRRERGDELSEPARVGAAGSHGAEARA